MDIERRKPIQLGAVGRGKDMKKILDDMIELAKCEAEYLLGTDEDFGGSLKEAKAADRKIEKAEKMVAVLLDSVELLRRGLERGVFHDAPVFRADVQKLLKRVK